MIFPREIWKDIKDYEGLYQVSNLGRVRSLNYNHTENKIKLLKQGNRVGYKLVALSKNKQRKTYSVHRLVAMAFIYNPDMNKYNEVNHKDEDKTNNCVWNLEWCDRKYNMDYGTFRERTIKYLINHNNEISKTVYQYDLYGNLVKEYPSTMEVQRQSNYSQGTVSSCCRGERNSAYGYIWSYKELTKEEIKKIVCKAKIGRTILQFDLNDNFIKEYTGINEIKKELGIKGSVHISDCCNGKRNKACGFKWKYKEIYK